MDLVPFHEKWAGSETKLDLKAWYRRPSVHGGFSLVGPLPLRRHLDWVRKGFDYVSLSTLEELGLVAAQLRAEGHNLDALRQAFDRRTGLFDLAAYQKTEQTKDTAFLADLQQKVDKHGAETVLELMRMQDPAFVMPASIVTEAPAAVKVAKK